MKKLNQKALKAISGGSNRLCTLNCVLVYQDCLVSEDPESTACQDALELCYEECYS